jgi:hypothetical protein
MFVCALCVHPCAPVFVGWLTGRAAISPPSSPLPLPFSSHVHQTRHTTQPATQSDDDEEDPEAAAAARREALRRAAGGAGDGDDWSAAVDAQTRATVASPFGGQGKGKGKGGSGAGVPLGEAELELTPANVDSVLEEVRPYLISDGGNIEVVRVEAETRNVRTCVRACVRGGRGGLDCVNWVGLGFVCDGLVDR